MCPAPMAPASPPPSMAGVRLPPEPNVPPTKFVEASGAAFNTIPPRDASFFGMLDANVQAELATS